MMGLSIVVALAIGLSPALAAPPETFGARDIFYKNEDPDPPTRMAAQFLLQLVKDKQTRRVSLEHVFQTGDEFQFVLTSNREAYLYVVNINPRGVASHLWPSVAHHESTNNLLPRGAETLVPASGTFEFGGTTGGDWLLVILSPFKQLPNLDRLTREFPDYQQAPGRVVEYTEIHTPPRNFGARGTTGLTEDPTGDDPAIYGAQRSSGERVLVYPYLMRHQPRNSRK